MIKLANTEHKHVYKTKQVTAHTHTGWWIILESLNTDYTSLFISPNADGKPHTGNSPPHAHTHTHVLSYV